MKYMNRVAELACLLGRYFVRLILIALFFWAVLILLGQEDAIHSFCDH